MNLYDIPKEMLIEIIINIQENEKKEIEGNGKQNMYKLRRKISQRVFPERFLI